jgi:hypothetical protein
MKGRARTREQVAKTFFPLRKRHRTDGFAIEMEEIEQEKDECTTVTGVRCVLDQAERVGRRTARRRDRPAALAATLGPQRRRVFGSPVERGAGQEVDRAAVEARMHPVAVELELVQPLWPIGRLVDQLGELRFNPTGERRRLGATPSEWSRHVFRHGAPAPAIDLSLRSSR